MKSWAWVLLLVLINACQKQELDPEIPVIGKWKMVGVVKYSSKAPLMRNQWMYENVFQGIISVEVNQDGYLKYESNKGKETLRIVNIENVVYNVDYSFDESPISNYDGYVFTVVNNKGKKFKFKFFYDSSMQQLIGVGWYKGVSYSTKDRPVSYGFHYGMLLYEDGGFYYPNSINTDIEFLGVFDKV